MKKMIIYSWAVISAFYSTAQQGWNWPEDADLKSQATEKQAYYKILLAQEEYNEAMKPLNWLYKNNPNLHQTIYIEGVNTLQKIMENVDNKERVEQLKDSVLWMYDQRMKYFNDDGEVMDRKALQAFQFYYKQPAKYPMLIELYENAYRANGAGIMTVNLNPYMFLAKLFHQHDSDRMPAEKVLDIHTQISEIIEIKRKNGEEAEKLKKEQDKTDAWLSSIEGILTCEFIENKLVPKFRENPADLATAKKIFKYSLEAKCTGEPYFLEASEPVFKEQPSFILANTLGSRYLANGDLAKGQKYFEQAVKLAATDEEKHDALMGQATVNSKKGNKSTARTLAYEALDTKPGSPEVYNLIGNLYFTSFDDCRGGESKVLDRSVFLAAYDMYKKAGNKPQMQASKEQFPSIEEIFNENYEEGQDITVGCWINRTVAIKRRD
ncbi:MAG: tetratricopeptide repeat protein [Ekhidna sp.]|nr:tetratricopeptide repeat protein [Ekhidna sp.]